MRGQKGRRWHDDPKDENERAKGDNLELVDFHTTATKVLKEFVGHFYGKSLPTSVATTTRILSFSQMLVLLLRQSERK